MTMKIYLGELHLTSNPVRICDPVMPWHATAPKDKKVLWTISPGYLWNAYVTVYSDGHVKFLDLVSHRDNTMFRYEKDKRNIGSNLIHDGVLNGPVTHYSQSGFFGIFEDLEYPSNGWYEKESLTIGSHYAPTEYANWKLSDSGVWVRTPPYSQAIMPIDVWGVGINDDWGDDYLFFRVEFGER